MGALCGSAAASTPNDRSLPGEVVDVQAQAVRRREIRRMSREEQDRWAAAVRQMMRNSGGAPESSEFFRIAGYHGWPSSYCEHAQESFPGWHRAYLCEFETALRAADRALGNDGLLALPYWDWMVDEINGERFPQVIQRHFQTMPDDLIHTENELKRQGWSLNPESSILQRMGRSQISDMVYRAFANEEHFMAASKRWTGDSLESPHDMVHVAAGFPMVSVAYAAFHPIFWLHHCNVDRLYEKYISSDPDSLEEMRSNQQRLAENFQEPNRFRSTYAPFKHPITGNDFMPRDAFDSRALGFEYEDLPPDRQLMSRFPSLAVFYPIQPTPSTYTLHVFVVKKGQEHEWKSPVEADFADAKVDSMPGYAGWGAAWGSKEVEKCENCKKRLPYSVRVDVSTALGRMGLKPSQASLKVVCVDGEDKIVPLPAVIPPPQLRGPFFEEAGPGAPELKSGDEGADVKAIQEYLISFGYLSATADGKFDERTKQAVLAFQRKFDMPQQDGVVRGSLKDFMRRPRSDDSPDEGGSKALHGAKPKLKVRVDYCPGHLQQDAVNAEVMRACEEWQAASSVSFECLPTESAASPDILVTWGDRTQNNLFLFDGKGGNLAHATKDCIMLDEAEYWVLQGSQRNPRKELPVELLPIILHELGHSLGLSHAGAEGVNDVMFPYYVPGRCSLSQGDRDRIAKLYPRT